MKNFLVESVIPVSFSCHSGKVSFSCHSQKECHSGVSRRKNFLVESVILEFCRQISNLLEWHENDTGMTPEWREWHQNYENDTRMTRMTPEWHQNDTSQNDLVYWAIMDCTLCIGHNGILTFRGGKTFNLRGKVVDLTCR